MLAVAATPGSTEAVRPLLRELAIRADVRPLDGMAGQPDAAFATSRGALRSVPAGVPTALWAADAAELASVAPTAFPAVYLSADPEAIGRGAVAVVADALAVAEIPFLPPLVRRRWRARLGLPDRLVVAVEPSAGPHGDALTNLALAAAAVVTGPLLASALALGTPVVTTAAEAARLGLRDGHEVDLADPDLASACEGLARSLADDEERAARMSLGARRFAEASLDLCHIADLVLDRLGLTGPPGTQDLPAALDRRLAELSTPSRSPVRARAAAAIAPFVSSADRS